MAVTNNRIRGNPCALLIVVLILVTSIIMPMHVDFHPVTEESPKQVAEPYTHTIVITRPNVMMKFVGPPPISMTPSILKWNTPSEITPHIFHFLAFIAIALKCLFLMPVKFTSAFVDKAMPTAGKAGSKKLNHYDSGGNHIEYQAIGFTGNWSEVFYGDRERRQAGHYYS